MTRKPSFAGRFAPALSGRLAQFNITLLLVLSALLVLLSICTRSSNLIISYGGSSVAILSLAGFVCFVARYYGRQLARPTNGSQTSLSLQTDDRKLTIENPPDALFEKAQLNTVIRMMLVGYDDNLCPDGEVLGNASEERYRLYSKEDQERFRKIHKQQIEGKKLHAAQLLDEAERSLEEPNQGGSATAVT